MAGTFWRVRDKLGRAKKHVSEVKELLEGFRQNEPYPLSFKAQPQKAWQAIVEVRFVERIEPSDTEVRNAFGDAVHNLRSTLDHLVWELTVRKLGYRPSEVPFDHWLRK